MAGQVLRIIYDTVLKPVVDAVNEQGRAGRVLVNSPEDVLRQAIRLGRIHYVGGTFFGEFNAAISTAIRKMGGTFNKTTKEYALREGDVPAWVIQEASSYMAKSKAAHATVLSTLDEHVAQIEQNIDKAELSPWGTVNAVEKAFGQFADKLGIPPDLNQESKEKLAQDYTDNMKLWIKKFAQETIVSLRQKVQANAEQGHRFSGLIKAIKDEYQLSATKAQFLARQETGLFMAGYRQARFAEAGVRRYIWQTAHDGRVRPSHKELDGRVFLYTEPPVVDIATGRRGNPGQDFNCFPADSKIEIADGIEKAFRRWYSGELTTLVLKSGETLRATPNHPVLTLNGWKPIGSLNEGDYVIQLADNLRGSGKKEGKNRISMIGEIFHSLRKTSPGKTLMGHPDQFHGDGSDRYVNVVLAARRLTINGNRLSRESLSQLSLAVSDYLAFREGDRFQHLKTLGGRNLPASRMGGRSQRLALFESHTGHTQTVRLGSITESHASLNKSSTNHNTLVASSLRDRKLALTSNVGRHNRSRIKDEAVNSLLRMVRVSKVSRSLFSGHVYNLQTTWGHYTTNGVVVSNCRCVDRAIIDNLTNARIESTKG